MAGWATALKQVAGWLAPPGTRRRRAAQRASDAVLARLYAWQGRTRAQLGPRPCLDDIKRLADEIGRPWPQQLAHRPGARLTHLYDQTNALRRAFPLGLTPAGRTALVACLLRQRGRLAVEVDEAVGFLVEMGGSASHGLADAYRRQPAWQLAVPHGLTRFGWGELKRWVSRSYGLGHPPWLDEAERPDDLHAAEELYWLTVARPELADGDVRAEADCARRAARRARVAGLCAEDGEYWQRLERDLLTLAPGVNLLAHFRYPSGLQIAARHTARALEGQGVVISRRDVPSNARADVPGRDGWLGLHPHRVTISHLAPAPLAEDCYPLCGLARRAGTYRIGYWYWELEDAPRRWARHAGWIGEVWAPTRFIADALRRVLPLPVYDMLPGIEMPPCVAVSRRELGLPEDRYLFLFAFDMGSTAARKNPMAAVAAFRRAFGRGGEAALVIKVSRGWSDGAALGELRAAADGRAVILIDEVAPRERVFALMTACDAYVSLHRSEGFGLTLAEAMALGKPVVATRYSGNLDFMTDGNSLLVDCRRVPVARTAGLYRRGATWAEPSVEHAAALMRWLCDSPGRGRAIGERARRDVGAALSLEAAGARMARRLADLGAAPGRRAAA